MNGRETDRKPARATRVRLATPWYVWALATAFAALCVALLLGPASWSDALRGLVGRAADALAR